MALVATGAAGWIGASTSAQAPAPATGVAATLTVRVDGGAPMAVQSFAADPEPGKVLNENPDTVRFKGSAVDPGGRWEVAFDYLADLDPEANATLVGAVIITNKSDAASDFDIQFQTPICPHIQRASRMGGSCVVKLVANQNGGGISTPGGSALFAALADASPVSKLFHGPFNMGTTGSGEAQTQAAFGSPFPNFSAPEVKSDVGLRHVLRVTDGDQAILSSTLVVGGDPADFVACGEAASAAGGAEATPGPDSAMPGPNDAPTSSSVTLGGDQGGKVMIQGGKSSAQRKAPPPKRAPAKPKAPPKPPAKAKSGSTKPPRSR